MLQCHIFDMLICQGQCISILTGPSGSHRKPAAADSRTLTDFVAITAGFREHTHHRERNPGHGAIPSKAARVWHFAATDASAQTLRYCSAGATSLRHRSSDAQLHDSPVTIGPRQTAGRRVHPVGRYEGQGAGGVGAWQRQQHPPRSL